MVIYGEVSLFTESLRFGPILFWGKRESSHKNNICTAVSLTWQVVVELSEEITSQYFIHPIVLFGPQ